MPNDPTKDTGCEHDHEEARVDVTKGQGARPRVVRLANANAAASGNLADLFVAAQRRHTDERRLRGPAERNVSSPQSRVHPGKKQESPEKSRARAVEESLPSGEIVGRKSENTETADSREKHGSTDRNNVRNLSNSTPRPVSRSGQNRQSAGATEARTIAPNPDSHRSPVKTPSVAVRTIQAALPPVAPTLSRRNFPDSANIQQKQTARVYPTERRRYDSEFDRAASSITKTPSVNNVDIRKPPSVAAKSEAESRTALPDIRPLTPARESRAEKSRRNASPARSGSAPQRERVLFDPHQHDPLAFKQPSAKSNDRASRSSPRINDRLPLPPPLDFDDSEFKRNPINVKGNSGSGQFVDNELTLAEYANQIYRQLVELETKLSAESVVPAETAVGEDGTSANASVNRNTHEATASEQYWVEQVKLHQRLAELHHEYLLLCLQPGSPQNIASLPQKYNTPNRLWQTAFYSFLERIRRQLADATSQSLSEQAALLTDFLIDVIQSAYIFYSGLLENSALANLRPTFFENLGDLSRYRMAVAGMLTRIARAKLPEQELSQSQVNALPNGEKEKQAEQAEQDDNATEVGASIGDAALHGWDVDDAEVWRAQAVSWYSKATLESPTNGRIYHQLALLARGDDLRVLYYCSRALLASQTCQSALNTLKAALAAYEADVCLNATSLALFLSVHNRLCFQNTDGLEMLIQRFLEKLNLELAESDVRTRARLLPMAVINISVILDYGATDSVLRLALLGNKETPSKQLTVTPQAIILGQPAIQRRQSDASERSVAEAEAALTRLKMDNVRQTVPKISTLSLACRLAFGVLKVALRCPLAENTVEPCITTMLNFLIAVAPVRAALDELEAHLPWHSLAELFQHIPATIDLRADAPIKLLGLPLDEDWLARGSEWSAKLFGRGFWKGQSDAVTVIESVSEWSLVSEMGTIECARPAKDAPEGEASARWKRVAVAAAILSKNSKQLFLDSSARSNERIRLNASFVTSSNTAPIRPDLAPLVDAAWTEEATYSDGDDFVLPQTQDRVLQKNQRTMRNLINMSRTQNSSRGWAAVAANNKPNTSYHVLIKDNRKRAQRLEISAAETTLVLDATVIMNASNLVVALLSSASSWGVVVPLAVCAELARIAKVGNAQSTIAQRMLQTINNGLEERSCVHVQTGLGNLLPAKQFRRFAENFPHGPSADWTLHTVLSQLRHKKSQSSACTVALVTFDRVLREKARTLGIPTMSDHDIVQYLSPMLPVQSLSM